MTTIAFCTCPFCGTVRVFHVKKIWFMGCAKCSVCSWGFIDTWSYIKNLLFKKPGE